MQTFGKKENILIIIAALAIVALTGVLNHIYGLRPWTEFLISIAGYVGIGIGAFSGLYAAHKIGTRNFVGKGLCLLGISMSLNVIGYLLWDYYEVILGMEVPYPSLADVSYSLAIPFAIAGVAMLLRIYQPQIKGRFLLEAIIMSGVLAFIVISIVGWPNLSESTYTAGFFDIIYTLTDVVWLALAYIILRIAGGRIFKGLFVYTIAIIVLAVGDILFALRIAAETYYYGDISDLTLLLGWILATAGIYLTAQTFSSSSTATPTASVAPHA
ncbi:MAG: hypothetical protein RL150_495 [Candidatus Parcubacteria bacterium]|jgi:hypothetical protein